MAELIAQQEVGPLTIEMELLGLTEPPGKRRGRQEVNTYGLTISHRWAEDGETFRFWDSFRATEEDTRPELHAVLGLVLDDAIHVMVEYDGPFEVDPTDEDFVTGFGKFVDYHGMDADASEALRTWTALNENANRILKLLSEDTLFELADAAREDELQQFDVED